MHISVALCLVFAMAKSMTATSISALLCVSTTSALLQQGINTQCDLGSVAPGSDVSCAASVEYIDNVVGSTDAIESTVTFSFLGGECWNPRISYEFRETDFADGDEFISLFQRGPTSVAGHMIVEGDGDDTTYGGAIKNAECALDTATDGSVTNDYGSKIGVQCCNDVDDASEAYRKELGCVKAVSFAEAEQLCASNGYRLCTQGEVQNGVGDGIGCSFNAYHVWTSTECRGTAITQCGDSGAATNCDSMTTCADLMVLPDGEEISGADSVDIVVYVSEDVDGLHHAADDGAICASEPYAFNVESILTLWCQTPTEAPTAAPTNHPSPAPTRAPSPQPTPAPTAQPTASPTTAEPTTGAPTMDGCDFSYSKYMETCHAGKDLTSWSCSSPRIRKINFQEKSYSTPSGYEVDSGEPYGSRSSGDLYGWDCDISEDTNNKGSRARTVGGGDEFANSLVVLDRHGRCANEKTMWKILVPNGVYSVTMGFGDAQYGVRTAGCTLQGISLGTGTFPPSTTLDLVTRTVTVVNQFIEFEGGGKHDCSSISTIVLEESVVSSAKGIYSHIDVDGDAVVMIKVSKSSFEMFVFAVVAISVLMCVGWCFRGVCRKKAGYAKVVYVSETETEENAAICDEQL